MHTQPWVWYEAAKEAESQNDKGLARLYREEAYRSEVIEAFQALHAPVL